MNMKSLFVALIAMGYTPVPMCISNVPTVAYTKQFNDGYLRVSVSQQMNGLVTVKFADFDTDEQSVEVTIWSDREPSSVLSYIAGEGYFNE